MASATGTGAGMRAALYCRKSNLSEKGVSGDSLSIERQRELARAFAESKGWTVDPAHVFVDDALSGTDFTNRRGLIALLSAAERKPHREYDILVMMDESRLGRDQFKTGYVLQRLSDAGVRVWFYQDAREAQLDTAIGKFMESVRGFGSELHVEKIRANTREGERATARNGYVAGGVAAFGYHHVKDGPKTAVRVHVEHAAVIQVIFALAAEGKGAQQIAKTLNTRKVPAPRGKEWTRTTIVSLLKNEQYIGRIVYGRKMVIRQGGVRKQVPAPEGEWIIRHDELLRIVSDAAWKAARAQIAGAGARWAGFRQDRGRLAGRPEGVTTSAHLLGGLLRCGACGAMMVPTSRGSAKSARLYYCCARRYKQGGRCSVSHMVSYDTITDAILGHFTHLHEDTLDRLVNEAWTMWQAEQQAATRSLVTVKAEVDRLDAELTNLADAVAQGGQSIPALVRALAAKQRARDEAAARLEHAQGLATPGPDDAAWYARLDAIVLEFAGTLRATLEKRGPEGRAMLRAIIREPISVSQVYENGQFVGWDYSGHATLGGLLDGRLGLKPQRGPFGRSSTADRRAGDAAPRGRARPAWPGRWSAAPA